MPVQYGMQEVVGSNPIGSIIFKLFESGIQGASSGY